MTAQAGDTASLSLEKSVLRRELRARRRGVPAAERRASAEQAARHLARACRRWGARRIAVYLALREELDTAPLIRLLRAAGCRLYAPKVAAGNRLRFALLAGPVTRNRHGIREPLGGGRAPRLDVVVVPLVAFDAEGGRLGLGGGYYDRLLARFRGQRRPLRVGYAYALQEVAGVPTDLHDARLHAVATERGVRACR